MAVAGVFALAAIGADPQPWDLFLDGANRVLDNAALIVSAGRQLVLCFWNPEQDHAADTPGVSFSALLDHLVDRELIVSRHGSDLAADACAGTGKQRDVELRLSKTVRA